MPTVWRRENTIYTAPAAGPEIALGTGKDAALCAHRGQLLAAWTAARGLVLMRGAAEPELLDPQGAYAQFAGTPASPVIVRETDGQIVSRILRESGNFGRGRGVQP